MNLIEDAGSTRAKTGVRPEDVEVASSPDAGWDDARVVVVEPMGSETLVTLEYRAQRLVARVPADCQFSPGQPVWVRWPPGRAITFDGATGARIG